MRVFLNSCISQGRALCDLWPCGSAGSLQENWPPPPQCDPSNPPAGHARPWLFAWSGTGWSSRSTTESSSRSQPTAGDRIKGNKGMNRLKEVMQEFETGHQQTLRQHLHIGVFRLDCKGSFHFTFVTLITSSWSSVLLYSFYIQYNLCTTPWICHLMLQTDI